MSDVYRWTGTGRIQEDRCGIYTGTIRDFCQQNRSLTSKFSKLKNLHPNINFIKNQVTVIQNALRLQSSSMTAGLRGNKI